MSETINAMLDVAYFDAREAMRDVLAQVTFEENGLALVTPEDSGLPARWHGERRGQGHYVLTSGNGDMEASLHRFAESTILEGFWRNGRERGFWRLHLPVDAVIPQEVSAVGLRAAAVKRRASGNRKRIRRAA